MKIFKGAKSHQNISAILQKIKASKLLLVCGSSFRYLGLDDYFAALPIPVIKFDNFTANPVYEDVHSGVQLFREEKCDAIIAVGGGSAIDIAKCIKLFCKMNPQKNYLKEEFTDSKIPLIVMPTTAGSGSEATRYAVIYQNGEKMSVTHDSIIPDYVLLDPLMLRTLPLYQRKCTLLDALSQGIESWWSINSTTQSKEYSKTTIKTIMQNYRAYLYDNEDFAAENSIVDESVVEKSAAEKILLAANYSGRAINIAQTTAPHAMSYMLTSLYSLPHGHSVALCLPFVFEYIYNNLDRCTDIRGSDYLLRTLKDISFALGGDTPKAAIDIFRSLLGELQILPPTNAKKEDIDILTASVNPTRLKNSPVPLDSAAISRIYSEMLRIV